jgi:hypothetical protein
MGGGIWNNPSNVTYLAQGGGTGTADLVQSEAAALGINNSDPDRFFAAYLLHEFGHHTGAFPDDRSNGMSPSYTKEVWKKCF